MLDLKDAEGNEAAKSPGEECTAKEQRDAEAEFAARVEERQVEDDASEEAGLEGTEKETNDEHAREIVSRALEESHRAPSYHHYSLSSAHAA